MPCAGSVRIHVVCMAATKTDSAQIFLKLDTLITRATYTEQDFELKTADDGCGENPLWVSVELCGAWGVPRAIVCAQTEGQAYEMAVDEMPTVKPGDLHEAYGMKKEEYEQFLLTYDPMSDESPDLAEGYTFQSNSSGTGIVYALDLHILPLTRERMEGYEIKLQIRSWDKQ